MGCANGWPGFLFRVCCTVGGRLTRSARMTSVQLSAREYTNSKNSVFIWMFVEEPSHTAGSPDEWFPFLATQPDRCMRPQLEQMNLQFHRRIRLGGRIFLRGARYISDCLTHEATGSMYLTMATLIGPSNATEDGMQKIGARA